MPGFPLAGAIERNLTEVRNLSPHIPSDVALGYHFCFGTLGGWPRFQPNDLSQAVELANGFVAASGRRVDWIHLPVLDRSDDAFFAPLANLKPQGARVYLGAIHNMERFRRADRHRAQVSPGLRPRRLLRLRPAAAVGAGEYPRRPSQRG